MQPDIWSVVRADEEEEGGNGTGDGMEGAGTDGAGLDGAGLVGTGDSGGLAGADGEGGGVDGEEEAGGAVVGDCPVSKMSTTLEALVVRPPPKRALAATPVAARYPRG